MEPGLQLRKVETTGKRPYQELIGALLYAATMTRPDISYATSYLGKFNNANDDSHWVAAKRVLRYLQGTKTNGISFRPNKDDQLIGYCDADWASDREDRRSVSGYSFMRNGVISWSSRRQNTIALSSTEAELIALTDATKENIWLQRLIHEIEGKKPPLILHSDNAGAIHIAKGEGSHNRRKHIDLRYKFLEEKINQKELTIRHVATERMPADILTKALPRIRHERCTAELGMKNDDVKTTSSPAKEQARWIRRQEGVFDGHDTR